MKEISLQNCIASAMDCDDPEIVPFLPYILQDFYEIGSSSKSILKIVEENTAADRQLHILDVGCGKGAVLLTLCGELNCTGLGIDAIREFIDEADKRMRSMHIEGCTFTCGDIRNVITELRQFNVIILASTGPVLGSYFETMNSLEIHLANEGIILLDDGYLDDQSDFCHTCAVKRNELMKQIDLAGMELKKEYIWDSKYCTDEYEQEYRSIFSRCSELSETYPEKKILFDNYVQKQKTEYHALEHSIICSAMVLGRKKGRTTAAG